MYHEGKPIRFRWHSVNGTPEELLSELRNALRMHKFWVVIRPLMGESIIQPDTTTTVYLRSSADQDVNMGDDREGIAGMYVSINTNHGLINYGFSPLNYLRVTIRDDDSFELAEGNFGDPEPTRVLYFIPQN